MLDTVEVKFPVSPTSTQLQDWVSHPMVLPGGIEKPKFFQNPKVDDITFNLTYYPPNIYYPEPQLRIGVSLPMVLHGNNVQLITEKNQIDEAIELTNQKLSRIPFIPTVDFGKGVLFRVDATYNHLCGDRVPDYIHALFNLEDDYPQREIRPWKYSGVQFFSKATTTTFYDLWLKHREPSALGFLRQETSMRGPDNLEKRMEVSSPTLNDLSIDWLVDTLDKDLKILKLDGAIIANKDLALKILKQKYDLPKAIRLYGYLISRQQMSREQFKAISDNTIRNWEKDIHAAGIALTMTDKVSLPPLQIMIKTKNIVGSL